jgi:hypothetical protein
MTKPSKMRHRKGNAFEMGSNGGEGVMNHQKKMKFDPFSCFREGHVIRKSCEESAESETGGQFS